MSNFEDDLKELEEQDIVEIVLNTPKKELNKNIFLEDALFDCIFSNGEKTAGEIFERLKVKAREVGVLTDFVSRYRKYRREFLTQVYGLQIRKPLNVPGFKKGDFEVPEQYQISRNGIFKYDYEVASYVLIFPHPVIVTERFFNISTGTEKNRIEFYDNGRFGAALVDATTISTSQAIVQLRSIGVRVTSENARNLVIFLSEFISANINRIPVLQSTSHLGWKNDSFNSFIPYDGNIIFDGEADYKEIFEAIECKGDYEKWKDVIKDAMQNEYTRAYIVASFASVLVPILKKLPFVVHLRSRSGTGKTVALYAAMSVWGNPVHLTSTFNDTLVHTE